MSSVFVSEDYEGMLKKLLSRTCCFEVNVTLQFGDKSPEATATLSISQVGDKSPEATATPSIGQGFSAPGLLISTKVSTRNRLDRAAFQKDLVAWNSLTLRRFRRIEC
ncbi:hypothetical protein Bbelb_261310 [Branchiostoma belcheri]|nr:hypothetical protein Bbelb_261310 [Branchiostoma belcheri]